MVRNIQQSSSRASGLFGFSFTRREKLFFGGREATTGNTSVVRRLTTERGSNFKCVLTDNPPSREEVGQTSGSTSPALFEQWYGFFHLQQEPDK